MTETAGQFDGQIEKLFQPREPFQSEERGRDSFNALGRRQRPIFLSNAGPDNEFAGRLVHALHLKNIKPFHYVFDNSIELGRDWRDELRAKLRSTQLFVPLISRAYWGSEWCRQEYETAVGLAGRGLLAIYPYFLDDPEEPVVPAQGRRLWQLPPETQIRLVVEDLDGYLTAGDPSAAATAPPRAT
jgi:TIR domain